MTVRLRPHHLLCLLTYVGKGYSAAFVANYDAIARRLSRGEHIEIVDGPDDICRPLLGEPEPHCWRDSVIVRDEQAARDEAQRRARALHGKLQHGQLPRPTWRRLRQSGWRVFPF